MGGGEAAPVEAQTVPGWATSRTRTTASACPACYSCSKPALHSNRHDVPRLAMVDAILLIGAKIGAPLQKQKDVGGDTTYNPGLHRTRMLATQTPRRNTPECSGLRCSIGRRAGAGPAHHFQRLRVREDQSYEAFTTLMPTMICWRQLHGYTVPWMFSVPAIVGSRDRYYPRQSYGEPMLKTLSLLFQDASVI